MTTTPPRGGRSIGFLRCLAFIPILALMGSLGDAYAAAGPTVASVTPSFAKPGAIVSIRGSGFGATRGSGYVHLSDAGGNWGAPHDAGLQIDTWSAGLITFVLPLPGGTMGQWRVTSGTRTTVTVTQSGATSKSVKLSVANTDNLADYFGNDGISPDDNRRCGANFDVGNAEDAYSANLLSKDGTRPGGTVKAGGLSFTWPSPANCYYDNIIAEGQTILMRPTRGATSLGFLGASANVTRSCTVTIKYMDGSISKKVITLADWGVPAAPGNIVVAHMKYRNTFKGPETKNGFSIFLAKTTVVKSKTVASITLSKTVLGNQSLRIFAMALNGTPAPVKPLLASLTPISGPAVGGTKVTIHGDYFSGATAVHFGSTAKAGSFVVVSDHSISATSPAGTGTVDISVSGPAGTSPKATGDRFTYLP